MLFLGALLACPLAAGDAPEQVSKDGLQLVKQTKQRLVYLKPGASFSQYRNVVILDCDVEFDKNWKQNYNAEQVGLQNKVTDGDIQRMKGQIAAEFKRVFTKELQKKGDFQVVDTQAAGVLVLRPAIVNVQVTAPDLMTASMQTTVVRSAGSATLYLELWDGGTSTILARVLDARADDQAMAQAANRVTNTFAADVILTSWADELRDHLDAARAQAGGK